MHHRLRNAAILVTLGLFAAMAVASFAGRLTIVITHGISMEPTIHQGDLVVVSKSGSYHVGQVAAYHGKTHDQIVLHRIVDGDAAGFVFQGDNNESIDPKRPTNADLLGRQILHIPQGGLWLGPLTSPPVLALMVFALLVTGGAVARTRRTVLRSRSRRRRPHRGRAGRARTNHPSLTARPAPDQGAENPHGTWRHAELMVGGPVRRRTPMSADAARPRRAALAPSELSPRLRTIGVTIAVFGVLAAALGALAWTRPVDRLGIPEDQPAPTMTFSYSTEVPRSAAYDGTSANSPDPIFRKLAREADIRYAYSGDPGTAAVTAELSTGSGWHSTLPLGKTITFTGNRHTGVVRLDLGDIDKRAAAAAKVIGIPAGPVAIEITPHIATANGATFAPSLRLSLTARQLALTGEGKSLVVTGTAAEAKPTVVPRTLGLGGRNVMTVAAARVVSIALMLAALLAALALVIAARRAPPVTEGDGIRRRYGPLLVSVEPMPSPPGRPVVNVTEFRTLTRLAERYELLIMYWTRNNAETYVLQDEGTTYIYRCGAGTADTATRRRSDDITDIASLESREH